MDQLKLGVNLNNIATMVNGIPPRLPWFRKASILVCRVDGCMSESLTPMYYGQLISKVRIKCHGTQEKDGKIAALTIRVNQSYNSQYTPGAVETELLDRLRQLSDGTYVILN